MNPVILVPSTSGDPRLRAYQDVKARIHNDLLNRLNLERLTQVGQAEAEPEIRRLILDLIERGSDTTPLSLAERETLVTDVLNELFGLGPLEALLRDGAISDILVNRFDQVYIERDGRRASARRLARERDHSATGRRWPVALDPPFPHRAARRRRPGRARIDDPADARFPAGRGR